MATVKQVIEKVYTKVNGEYEEVLSSTEDFRTYLNVLNQAMSNWFSTPYVKWQSLYNPDFTLASPVTDGVLEYTVPDITEGRAIVANSPFDALYFVEADGKIAMRYTITDQAFFDASTAKDIAMIAGDKLILKSIDPKIVGATIKLPMYVAPPVYTSGAEEVKVDSVPWLVAEMAAFICDSSPVPFIARNADKYHAEADKFLRAMKSNNRHRQHLVIKSGDRRGTPKTWQEVMALGYMRMRDL